MIDNVGFGVAQTVKYGYYLETDHDGKYAVCGPAVNHFKPNFDEFLKKINASSPKGDLEEWYAAVKAAGREAVEGMALETETWARNNHPWTNRTYDAEKGLTGYTIIDGVTRTL
jgi:hypothetical protein